MPLYEYWCTCGAEFEAIVPVDERHAVICPKCGLMAKKKISLPTPKTDTSFAWAGIKDRRLGDEPIRSRKDFESRLDQKGLAVATKSDIDDMFVDHDPSAEVCKIDGKLIDPD